ncbi:hypothetical protein ES705_12663 [subsurface metagenome]
MSYFSKFLCQAISSLCILVCISILMGCQKIEPVRITKISTGIITDTTASSCSAQGIIIDVGEEGIVQHGHCWSTSKGPTISNDTTELGSKSSAGSFNSHLTGLLPNTKYYVRTYAINSVGTIYGNEVDFTTLQNIVSPTVSTNSPTSITTTSAIVGGEVTSDGGATVTERGIYWGTKQNPRSTGTKLAIGSGTGSFSTTLTELSPGTPYYVEAYAVNTVGPGYGDTVSFKTEPEITIPTVSTSLATSVTTTSATIGGEVTSNGGATVIERGVYWGPTQYPRSTGTRLATGSGTGTFSANLNGLSPGTIYYFEAYAINSVGPGYGDTISFKTDQEITLPAVKTNPASSVTTTSSVVGGEVTSDGGGTVTEKGIFWSTVDDPRNTGSKLSIGSDTGSFSTNLTGLVSGRTYYIEAYATNSKGTAYGAQKNFTTLLGDIDGNVYQTITIGTQTWMAENLATTTYNNGTAIPLAVDNSDWLFISTAAYCNYDDNESFVDTYGRLYNLYAVTSPYHICPTGWHIPSDEEWTILETYLGGSTVAGGKLKETSYAHWNSPNSEATNESGFTALPGGSRGADFGDYGGMGYWGYWWSSTYDIHDTYWIRVMFYDSGEISRVSRRGATGYSVRCVRD